MSETVWNAIDDGWVIDRNGERVCQCAGNDEADRLIAATDKLRADLTALRERMRWVPVGERLPMDLLSRIVVDDSGYVFPSRVVLPYGAGKWLDFDGETVTTKITHWMELPIFPT